MKIQEFLYDFFNLVFIIITDLDFFIAIKRLKKRFTDYLEENFDFGVCNRLLLYIMAFEMSNNLNRSKLLK